MSETGRDRTIWQGNKRAQDGKKKELSYMSSRPVRRRFLVSRAILVAAVDERETAARTARSGNRKLKIYKKG
jgi:hypothetical protein